MKQRIKYSLIIVIIIASGLLSRKIGFLPSWIGDMLYATMMYFIVRFVCLQKDKVFIAACSLGICFLIEFSQLYQAGWINTLRSTLPGRLVLGQGFLWSDLPAYTLGVAIAFVTDTVLRQNNFIKINRKGFRQDT